MHSRQNGTELQEGNSRERFDGRNSAKFGDGSSNRSFGNFRNETSHDDNSNSNRRNNNLRSFCAEGIPRGGGSSHNAPGSAERNSDGRRMNSYDSKESIERRNKNFESDGKSEPIVPTYKGTDGIRSLGSQDLIYKKVGPTTKVEAKSPVKERALPPEPAKSKPSHTPLRKPLMPLMADIKEKPAPESMEVEKNKPKESPEPAAAPSAKLTVRILSLGLLLFTSF